MAIEWLLSTPVVRIRSELSNSDLFISPQNIFCILHIVQTFAFFSPTVNTPHFLTIKGVEVNAGQTASFHCTVNGRKRDNFRLWLQVRKRCWYVVVFFYTSEMHICYLAGSSGLSFFFFFSLIDDRFQTIKLNTEIKIL